MPSAYSSRARRSHHARALACLLLASACSSDPHSDAGTDAGNHDHADAHQGGPDAQPGQDADTTPDAYSGDVPVAPNGSMCPAVDPAPIAGAHTIGSGSPDGCTEAALTAAVGAGGTIAFNCGSAPVTIAVHTTLRVAHDTVIDGGNLVTLDGGGAASVFSVATAVHFTAQNLTIANGHASGTERAMGGAAILAGDDAGESILTVVHCTFQNNAGVASGPDFGAGAIYAYHADLTVADSAFVGNHGSNGGAIGVLGSNLTIVRTTFDGNAATGTGGGADAGPNGQGGLGGAIYIDGVHHTRAPRKLTLCGDVFTHNHSNLQGGALFAFYYDGQSAQIAQSTFRGNAIDDDHDDSTQGLGGAIYHQAAPLDLSDSTIAENTSADHAGGIYLGSDSPTTITNTTIVNNRTDMRQDVNGGGLWTGDSVVRIVNSTIAGNHAWWAPGIFGGPQVTLVNTIVANNVPGQAGLPENCDRAMIDGGGNLQFATSTGDRACVAGIRMADPKLGDLGDNGGPTPTVPLQAGSAAIDQGVDSACPPTDQRGHARNGRCDVGAYEF